MRMTFVTVVSDVSNFSRCMRALVALRYYVINKRPMNNRRKEVINIRNSMYL